MKALLLSNSFPIHPRLLKLANYVETNDGVKKLDVCAWDRSNGNNKKVHTSGVYSSDIGYGNKLKKLIHLFGFALHLRGIINKYSPDIIVCRYWDMFFLASLVSPKGVNIYYDVCDMPSNTIIRYFEKLCIKRADRIFLASRFFKPFYKHKRIVLFENKPDLSMISPVLDRLEYSSALSSPIKIAFIGKVRYFEVMKNMLVASNLNDSHSIIVNIYGDGPDEQRLRDFCTDKGFTNVSFFGAYDYSDIAKFYTMNDVIWAAYDSDKFNVKHAISNKYFESLFFCKPAIYSKETQLGSMVEKDNIGFVVNESSTDDIGFLFSRLIADDDDLYRSVIESIEKFNDNMQ
ncbi:Glycosyltransferase involved in cell wall bisynthesis [Vibrio chagasii]|nr:Glycosyltransferase involved in cell wall bisynthesis [Vibrio chagasii]CAH7094264.1 Glycosyltransferase involved in cell wall bisynthesis [Vibrio chagasii]CAH7119351.1 Glycosyltransferase involved in cell wall bisynthesis [Vibrio chagasii]